MFDIDAVLNGEAIREDIKKPWLFDGARTGCLGILTDSGVVVCVSSVTKTNDPAWLDVVYLKGSVLNSLASPKLEGFTYVCAPRADRLKGCLRADKVVSVLGLV